MYEHAVVDGGRSVGTEVQPSTCLCDSCVTRLGHMCDWCGSHVVNLSGTQVYLLMELCSGGSLADIIKLRQVGAVAVVQM